MAEIKILAGKHKCGKRLEIRMTDVRKNEKDKGSVFSWIVYGICKKCKTILMLYLFIQVTAPIPGTDFIIDLNLKTEDCEKNIQ